jgi:competence protein ComEC
VKAATALLCLCLLGGIAHADLVTPSPAVTSSLRVRARPDLGGAVLTTLKPGQLVNLRRVRPGWLEIELTDGRIGHVSRPLATVVVLPSGPEAREISPRISLHRAETVAEIGSGLPVAGSYRVLLFDVGTGLSILVQGHDFSLLYDGGSKDDRAGPQRQGTRSRLIAYLFASLGVSGASSPGSGDCVPEGDSWPLATADRTIDHVILSHPHDDHGNLLGEVLHCYRVVNVWDSGRINDTYFYRELMEAVAAEPAVRYHTASAVPADRGVTVKGATVVMPAGVAWSTFADGEVVRLGAGATMTILHADASRHADPNQNSIVVRLDLGGVSMLLTGDAESGARREPSAAPGEVEAELLSRHRALLDVDILQVGHHGSLTSSRAAFLAAVSPRLALVGVGPFKYAKVRLPDAAVMKAVAASGAVVLRTDLHDGRACPAADRVGRDDATPGGCDAYEITIH